jgi:transcriptional regulator with XRE-family HTH domain
MPETPNRADGPTAFASYLASLVPAVCRSDLALADALGVHRSTVMRWRRGAVPTIPHLLRLATATGTPPEVLLKIAGYSEGGDR